MRIVLNGEPHDTTAATVAELLRELEAPAIGVAVARNSVVVRKGDHAATILEENDNIELIRAVQGG